jgi:hypothetical protein
VHTEVYSSFKSKREKSNRVAANTAGAPADWRQHFSHYLGRSLLQTGPVLFGSFVAAVIVAAWWHRDEGYLTAETGTGYWLGIIGGIIMLLLVGYPLRKRLRILSGLGRISGWFRLHMVLGILGPALVVLHTNFNLGSLNSRLALLTMLIVVSSGVVGRYLYGKVHKGLYGQYTELRDIVADMTALKSSLGEVGAAFPHIIQRLEWHSARVSNSPRLFAVLTSGARLRRERRRMVKDMEKSIVASPQWKSVSRRQRRAYMKELDQRLRLFYAAVKKAERLRLYDRMFSMWHHLHLPLFVMLALTVVIHIIAVHRY